MYDFIKLQYQMGKIKNAEVLAFVPKWISIQQANEIINGSKGSK